MQGLCARSLERGLLARSLYKISISGLLDRSLCCRLTVADSALLFVISARDIISRRGGTFDSFSEEVKVTLPINVLFRGGRRFNPSERSVQVDLPFNILPRGVEVLIPCEKKLKSLCQSLYCPEGVVDLIPHENKLKLILHLIFSADWDIFGC